MSKRCSKHFTYDDIEPFNIFDSRRDLPSGQVALHIDNLSMYPLRQIHKELLLVGRCKILEEWSWTSYRLPREEDNFLPGMATSISYSHEDKGLG